MSTPPAPDDRTARTLFSVGVFVISALMLVGAVVLSALIMMMAWSMSPTDAYGWGTSNGADLPRQEGWNVPALMMLSVPAAVAVVSVLVSVLTLRARPSARQRSVLVLFFLPCLVVLGMGVADAGTLVQWQL